MDADSNDRTERRFYQAYLVRLWRESSNVAWRASAQSAEHGEITRFGTLQALFSFLEGETGEDASRQTPGMDQDDEDQA
jgi:hypothetical protein